MSCYEEQGTAAPDINWPFEEDAGSSVATSGYLQVIEPEEFTRDELQEMRDKAQAQLDWSSEGVKGRLLRDLVETLDLLDALEAREELDLGTMTIVAVDVGIPRLRPDTYTHVTHNAPPCGPNCPYSSGLKRSALGG